MTTRAGVLEGFVSMGMPRTAAELVQLFERGAELPADRSLLLRLDGPDQAAAMARCGELSSNTSRLRWPGAELPQGLVSSRSRGCPGLRI